MRKPTKATLNQRGIEELKLLFEVSQILDYSLDLKEIITPALESLAEHLGLLHATVTLLNRQKDEILIECAHGLTTSQKILGRYKPGEGVTGKVVQTGRVAVIKKINESPAYINRTKRLNHQEFSFICVPIKIGREVDGALSADRKYNPEADLEDDVRLLSIIASLIAQAVKLRQTAQEQQARLEEENERLRLELKDRFKPANILGNSREMQVIYQKISEAIHNTATVFILGESGTGKEGVAEAIHFNSERANRQFVRINCATLAQSQMEGELFGYARGANDEYPEGKKGAFELANGGTLFLDEISELNLKVQAKLLRVLEEKQFERISGTHSLKTNFRLIVASTKEPQTLVATGHLREALLLRINVLPISLPPLRKRKADILLLSDNFLAKYAEQHNKSVKRLSSAAIDMLYAYHWPGNVRELENVIEWAVLRAEGEVVHARHLPPTLQTAEASDTESKGNLKTMVEAYEKDIIVDALKSTRGSITGAARMLQSTERILGYKIKNLRINPKQYVT